MAQARTSVTANTRSSSSKSPSPSKPTVTSSNGSNGELETKFSSVLDKANKNLLERDNGKKDEGKKNNSSLNLNYYVYVFVLFKSL